MTRTTTTLTELARLGFADLGAASVSLSGVPESVVPLFAVYVSAPVRVAGPAATASVTAPVPLPPPAVKVRAVA